MIKRTPESLAQEMRYAERMADAHLSGKQELVQKLVGKYYNDGSTEMGYVENRPQEYLSVTQPRIVFDNPRASVRSRSVRKTVQAAGKAIQAVTNSQVRSQDLRWVWNDLARDTLLGYGASTVLQRPSLGFDPKAPGAAPEPHLYYMPPERFLPDPMAINFRLGRYQAQKVYWDVEDLLDHARENPDEGWNEQTIRGLLSDNITGRRTGRLQWYESESGSPRQEVSFYEIWFPGESHERTPEEGYNGVIYTLGASIDPKGMASAAGFVRAKRDFYGPEWGPFQTYGAYSVPGSPYPLSPLIAAMPRLEEMDAYMRVMMQEARNYKRIMLCPAGNPKIFEAVSSDPNNYVKIVPGMDRDAQPITIELGGITQQHVAVAEIYSEQTDRVLGVNDTVRGSLGASGPATEFAIADTANSNRAGFLRQQFADGVRQSLRTMAWYNFHDARIVVELGPDEIAEAAGLDVDAVLEELGDQAGETGVWFLGGTSEAEFISFRQLDLEIDVMSMERTNEALQQQRGLEAVRLVAELAPMTLQNPQMDWSRIFRQIGDLLNIPNLSDVYDSSIAASISGGQPDPGQTEPRLAGRQAGTQVTVRPNAPSSQPATPTSRFAEARQRGQEAAGALQTF